MGFDSANCCDLDSTYKSSRTINLCFTCGRIETSAYFSNTVLLANGVQNSSEEKQKVMTVICQLLRVKCDFIENIFIQNEHLPFCELCLKPVVQLIGLREQLFQIETDIRGKIKDIEASIASSFKPQEDHNFEWKEDKLRSDYRQSFQNQVMEEYWNKKLLQEKIEETNQIQNNSVEIDLSLIQLQLEKNVFVNTKYRANTPNEETEIVDLLETDEFDIKQKNLDFSQVSFAMRKCETELDDRNNQELEFNFRLVCPTDEDGGDDISNSKDNCDHDISMPTLRKRPKLESPYDRNEAGLSIPKSVVGQNADRNEDQDALSDEDVSLIIRGDIYEPDEFIELPPSTEEVEQPILNACSSASDDDSCEEDTVDGTSIGSHHKYDQIGEPAKKLVKIADPNATQYKARDDTIWSTKEPRKTKKNSYKIPKMDGKLVGQAANPDLTPAEIFKLMISTEMVDLIVKYTNSFIKVQKQNTASVNSDEKHNELFKETCAKEIYAFIGILLNLGIERKSMTSLQEAWDSSGKYSIPSIAASMSKCRFRILQGVIRFDDQEAREKAQAEGRSISNLSYISEVFDQFLLNIQAPLSPSDSLVVDELIIKKGNSNFHVNEDPGSAKRGLKIWACRDASTGYILRLIIYLGKQRVKIQEGQGRKLVSGLVKKYFGSTRGVTTTEIFTSKALALDLIQQNMSLLGTLKKYGVDVIPEFTHAFGRQVQSSIFAFQDDLTMVSYVPKKNKSVILLSTRHHTRETNTKNSNKPTIVMDYNRTKGAVDIADKMMSNLSCQRKTLRWPMKMFFAICDIGALNAYLIWQIHQKKLNSNSTHITFLRMLSEALMIPVIKTRASNPTSHMLSPHIKASMELMGYSPLKPPKVPPPSQVGRGRCEICTGSARYRKASFNRCVQCVKFICRSHCVLIYLCLDCKPDLPHLISKSSNETNNPMVLPNLKKSQPTTTSSIKAKKLCQEEFSHTVLDAEQLKVNQPKKWVIIKELKPGRKVPTVTQSYVEVEEMDLTNTFDEYILR